MFQVDLNCDLGESFGAYKMGNDELILDYVTSANIACGFHAGDPHVMRKTVELALEKNVKIGAHPGFPDLVGFGRNAMHLSPHEVFNIVTYQIGALQALTTAFGGKLEHVKPHGALYNLAAKDESLSTAIAEAIYAVNPEFVLYGLSGSELIKAGEKIGLKTASEVFSDRTYQADGSLTSRTLPNALITDDHQAVEQILNMITKGTVQTVQQTSYPIVANTVCIHGDGVHALQFAQFIHQRLTESGIQVTPFR